MDKKKNQKMKSWLITLLKMAIAAGLIYWMVDRGALDFDVLRKLVQPQLIFVFLILTLLQIGINALRWQWLLRGQGVEVTFGYSMAMSLIGLFFNFFMPGGVGGDVVKGYYLLSDHPSKKVEGATSILVDRLLGMYMMLIVALGAILLHLNFLLQKAQLVPLIFGVVVFFLLMSFAFAISLSRRAQSLPILNKIFDKIIGGRILKRVYETIHSYRNHMKILGGGLILSFASQMVMIGFMILAANAMGILDIPLGAYFFAVPLALVCTALPISPAGIGVGQAAIFFLFNVFLGRETQLGPNAFTLYQLVIFAWGLLGGLVYLRRKSTTSNKVLA